MSKSITHERLREPLGPAFHRLGALSTRSARGVVPPFVMAPLSADDFWKLTNDWRRETVARWALLHIEAHGADRTRRVVLEIVAAVDAQRTAADAAREAKAAARTAPPEPPATLPVAQWFVTCADGCGAWLPARPGKAVARFVTQSHRGVRERRRRAARTAAREAAE